MEASGRISGRRVGVLGLDDHTLEQVVEFVGCLGVEFVIVFLQGAREQAGIGDWGWIPGLAQVHYNPEGFAIETYTFMECRVRSVHQEGAQSMTAALVDTGHDFGVSGKDD